MQQITIKYETLLCILKNSGVSCVGEHLIKAIRQGLPVKCAIAGCNRMFMQKEINGDQHGEVTSYIYSRVQKQKPNQTKGQEPCLERPDGLQ